MYAKCESDITTSVTQFAIVGHQRVILQLKLYLFSGLREHGEPIDTLSNYFFDFISFHFHFFRISSNGKKINKIIINAKIN